MADAADGAEDNVVALCPGCALSMEGDHQHALQVSAYSLHFCSAECKERFAEDTEGSLIALVVPPVEDMEEP
jgi:hypothetical protein